MIQIAFCDDDQTVLDQLSALLEKYRAQRCVQIQCTAFHSPLDLLAEIEKGHPVRYPVSGCHHAGRKRHYRRQGDPAAR